MSDLFAFPTLRRDTPEEQIEELVDYLIQFKETLEFVLTNISAENLSEELRKKFDSLEEKIEKNKNDNQEEMAQISQKNFYSTTE